MVGRINSKRWWAQKMLAELSSPGKHKLRKTPYPLLRVSHTPKRGYAWNLFIRLLYIPSKNWETPVSREGQIASLSLDSLSDRELQRSERRVQLAVNTKPQFIPAFPLRILQALAEADAVVALPLVLAIHRQLVMSRREETPLNEELWNAAGSPTAKKRAVILRKLKSLPEVIQITAARTRTTHYRVRKGDLWT